MKTASVSIAWRNIYYGLWLDELEEDATHDPGGLGLWGCKDHANQMWAETIIAAHPASIAKNLVGSKCVTYPLDPAYGMLSVWLAPCGQDGQELIRSWNGKSFIFHAAELPDRLCLSVISGPVAEGFTGIQLRPCDPYSPLTDWLPSS